MKIIAICAGKLTTIFYRTKEGNLKTVVSEFNKNVISAESKPATIQISKFGLPGDEKISINSNESLNRSLYMIPVSHYDFWRSRLKQHNLQNDINFGSLGENLVIEGIDESSIKIGDEISIGDTLLQVTEPRIPNYQLNIKMGYNGAVKDLIQAGHCGWYLKVIETGQIKAGNPITVIPTTGHMSVLKKFREITNDKQLNLLSDSKDKTHTSLFSDTKTTKN